MSILNHEKLRERGGEEGGNIDIQEIDRNVFIMTYVDLNSHSNDLILRKCTYATGLYCIKQITQITQCMIIM